MDEDSDAWRIQAESDYIDANLLWDNRRYGSAILFYQQAVEKLLKAYIVKRGKRVPKKTHRLELLLTDAGIKLSGIKNIDIADVEELSKAYIRVRYPDLSRQYYRKRADAEPLAIIGKGLYLWIKNIYKKR